ncbi:MAG: hypothetical protein ACRD2I_07540 [Vicinamibacterales bacterium]
MQPADRSTAAARVRATARTKRRFEHGPLGAGQVHAIEYDGDHTDVQAASVFMRQLLALQRAAAEVEALGFRYICTMNLEMVPHEDVQEEFDFESFVRLRLTDAAGDTGRLLGIRFDSDWVGIAGGNGASFLEPCVGMQSTLKTVAPGDLGTRSRQARDYGGRRSWRPDVARKVLERNHPVLQIVENTGRISWLGGRDSNFAFVRCQAVAWPNQSIVENAPKNDRSKKFEERGVLFARPQRAVSMLLIYHGGAVRNIKGRTTTQDLA